MGTVRSGGGARPGERQDRARRAFELVLKGYTYRDAAAMMKREGYRAISGTTVGQLVREHTVAAVLPLAREHVTREFERLMAQRVRLERGMDAAWAIYDAEHVAHSNGRVVRLEEGGEPLRDHGPRARALAEVRGFEDLILKNTEAMARLFGYNATVRTEVTVITETDRAIADLVGEMDTRDARDVAPTDVGG